LNKEHRDQLQEYLAQIHKDHTTSNKTNIFSNRMATNKTNITNYNRFLHLLLCHTITPHRVSSNTTHKAINTMHQQLIMILEKCITTSHQSYNQHRQRHADSVNQHTHLNRQTNNTPTSNTDWTNSALNISSRHVSKTSRTPPYTTYLNIG
jgi:hypothetical protein